ncbi:DUF1707 domain-containing protein [Streptomyces sp. SID11385]|uniref:DUF1707 SHOCT-like domain-containing protein n=1 Tax=Streptomyces sp. SID11385 TaxID=2706031 RepID=UPI0013C9C7D4|nr:DUF1707 domain-containing protein [Streptomyces sp. SID11385]NEA38028.1 DUF1707 domain-containing protein [Streptomyces sp. SID11385]
MAKARADAPLADAELRASDADRERVAERLREAVAEGRLDMEEFDVRLGAAYAARTYGELVPLTRDLPESTGGAARSPAPAPGGGRVGRVGAEATSRGAFALFGGFARRGRWVVGRVFTAFAMWGGGEIDLREADFEDRETVIRCFTIWGGIGVVVPPELRVRVSGIGIMGGFGGDQFFDGPPDSPQVTVKGFALMGGVGVQRKRRKGEKKGRREQLGPSGDTPRPEAEGD